MSSFVVLTEECKRLGDYMKLIVTRALATCPQILSVEMPSSQIFPPNMGFWLSPCCTSDLLLNWHIHLVVVAFFVITWVWNGIWSSSSSLIGDCQWFVQLNHSQLICFTAVEIICFNIFEIKHGFWVQSSIARVNIPLQLYSYSYYYYGYYNKYYYILLSCVYIIKFQIVTKFVIYNY